jgi:hypothetical protein
MRTIGFSTGALALGDFRRALGMVEGKGLSAIELSALRQDELQPLAEQIGNLDLSAFNNISYDAPI